MSWWGERKAVQILEPAVPIDREAELREELRQVEVSLSQLNSEMREFRTAHSLFTDRFNRIVSMRSASMNGRASVERDWRGYNARANQLVIRHNALLRELATMTVPGFVEEANR